MVEVLVETICFVSIAGSRLGRLDVYRKVGLGTVKVSGSHTYIHIHVCVYACM